MKKFFYIFLIMFIASSLHNTMQCGEYWQRLKNYWSNPRYYQMPSYISPYKIYRKRAEVQKFKKALAAHENLTPEEIQQIESDPYPWYGIYNPSEDSLHFAKGKPEIETRWRENPVTKRYEEVEVLWDPVSKKFLAPETNASVVIAPPRKEIEYLKQHIQRLEQNQRSILDLLLTPQSPVD
ncbi:MAG TPA: hypothetical protein VGW78_02620 [Candidatus Babeliales bacterium]|jgi:hypothetical protein|nr:hypothetical protein [Candidatus Babeliales bacterium]